MIGWCSHLIFQLFLLIYLMVGNIEVVIWITKFLPQRTTVKRRMFLDQVFSASNICPPHRLTHTLMRTDKEGEDSEDAHRSFSRYGSTSWARGGEGGGIGDPLLG